MKRITLLLSVVCLAAQANSPPAAGALISQTIILDESQYVGKPCTIYSQNYQNPLTGHVIACLNVGGNFNVNVVGAYAVLNTGGGGSVFWGSILGTLSNQADLQAALNAKQNTLTLPLSVANGGTGTATPALVAGTNVTITGSWPNQTINSTASGTGTVTHTVGALTSGQLIIGNGSADVKVGDLSGDVSTSGGTTTTMAAVGSAGSCGDGTHSCQLTFDTKGRETARANVAITGSAASSITSGLLSGIPATCAAGAVYFATDQPANQQLYTCSATNTFTQSGLLGASGGLTMTSGALDIDTSVVCRLTNSCSISASWNYGSASATQPNKTGLAASIPATCTVGQTYFETDAAAGQNVYGCTATNTWTQQGGSGGFTKQWVKAFNSTGQAITTNTFTNLSWDTNSASNTGSAITHSTVTNPDRFTAVTAGYYHGACQFFSSSGISGAFGMLQVDLNVSGADTVVGISEIDNQVNITHQASFSVHMAVGDYVHCATLQNSGSTVTSDTTVTSFWIEN